MSVSEGIKKYGMKNYYVRLVSLVTSGDQINLNKKGTKIQPWTKVNELKSKIGKYYGVSNKNIRLFFCNTEMMDELTMLDYQVIDNKKAEIFYRLCHNEENSINIQVYAAFPCPNDLTKIIEDIRHGFIEGLIPNLNIDGTSGTYMMRNTDKDTVALFKPIDEEAFAPNNQKGYTGKFGQESFRKGILSGEGSIREVAAYLLDKSNYFNVPGTTFVEISHPTFNRNVNDFLSIENQSISKLRNSVIHNFLNENLIAQSKTKEDYVDTLLSNSNLNNYSKYNYIKKKYGSLQQFIKSHGVAADFGSLLFDVKSVHKIGVFDIRILNCDRNDENILVQKKKDKTTGEYIYKLIPIDHSLSFPDCIKIQEYEMCWMGWIQSHQPFSKEMLSYIKKIDILADIKRISQIIKLRDNCWSNFRISNIVLKLGAEFGLNLYQIGMLLYKPEFDEQIPTVVDTLIEKTEKICSLYSTINKNTLTDIFNSKELENEEINDAYTYLESYGSFKTDYNSQNVDDDSNYNFSNEEQNINTNENKNTIKQNEEIKNVRISKKKNSLLKRTASEPRLLKNESNSETNENEIIVNSTVDTLNHNDIKFEYNGDHYKKFNKNKSNFKEKLFANNQKEDYEDSHWNEIFFYNFENVLIEYLQKNYKN